MGMEWLAELIEKALGEDAMKSMTDEYDRTAAGARKTADWACGFLETMTDCDTETMDSDLENITAIVATNILAAARREGEFVPRSNMLQEVKALRGLTQMAYMLGMNHERGKTK